MHRLQLHSVRHSGKVMLEKAGCMRHSGADRCELRRKLSNILLGRAALVQTSYRNNRNGTAIQTGAALSACGALYRKEGAVEVRSEGEAQQVLQAAADSIHGLGRGGNVPQTAPQQSAQGTPC